jgi:hypothetical protein
MLEMITTSLSLSTSGHYKVDRRTMDQARSIPAVSVVMPVYNGLPYLDDSIESILGQTFEDFELLVLDDGSTDGSGTVLRSWAERDPRIRLFASPEKLGHAGASNFITSKATAPVVARMDADDVSHPDRLRREWQVLRREADAVLVLTLADSIDSRGRLARPRDRWPLVAGSGFVPFPHGSCMFRRALFDELGGLRDVCEPWGDQDLFWRMADKGRILVLPDVLYRYRYHATATTIAYLKQDPGRATELRARCLAERRAGRDYTHLLEEADEPDTRAEATVGALRWLGGIRLWSGQRTGVLGAILRSGSLSPSTLPVLLWAAWGSVSPGSLRLVLRGLIRVRDFAASVSIKGGRPLEWRLQ